MIRPTTFRRPALSLFLLLQQIVQFLVRGLAFGIRLLLSCLGELLLRLLNRLRAKGFQPFHIDLWLFGLRLRRGLRRLVHGRPGRLHRRRDHLRQDPRQGRAAKRIFYRLRQLLHQQLATHQHNYADAPERRAPHHKKRQQRLFSDLFQRHHDWLRCVLLLDREWRQHRDLQALQQLELADD